MSQQQQQQRFVHPDQNLAPGRGVTYSVQYMGNVPVLASTRSLKADVRNQVTRVAIGMCCEASGALSPDRRRRPDRSVSAHLGERPVMQFSGWSAGITISTRAIAVVAMETQETIAHHNLINVSFASGGDSDTLDYVAYVAKDSLLGRACHVIKCPEGLAADVVSTIGQAFELRYKGVFGEQPPPPPSSSAAAGTDAKAAPQYVEVKACGVPGPPAEVPVANLLNLDDEDFGGGGNGDSVVPNAAAPEQNGAAHIVPSPPPRQPATAAAASPVSAVLEPAAQPWYHGAINRQQAERLLAAAGDFLVRSATGQPGQYVLSGRMAEGRCKHLLLVDPEGRVRTRDRAFESLEQLVAFHVDSRLPIVSDDSELVLCSPVLKLLR